MGADILITEGEPGRLDAVGPKLLHDSPALVLPTPAAYRIPASPEGVHDRVEIGADSEAVQGDVIGGISNHSEVRGRIGVAYPERELRAADATGQDHDLHRTSVPSADRLVGSVSRFVQRPSPRRGCRYAERRGQSHAITRAGRLGRSWSLGAQSFAHHRDDGHLRRLNGGRGMAFERPSRKSRSLSGASCPGELLRIT